MELLDGKITDYNQNGEMTIRARYDNIDKFIRCNYSRVRILLEDSRTITPDQRKKIYAMMSEISDFVGEYPTLMKRQLKLDCRRQRVEKMCEDFSLSDCSVETASEFIDFLTETIIAWGVPLKRPLSEYCEDIRRYVRHCLMYKKCAVCGRNAELHHIDVVGMGNDRKEIPHEGKRALALCRKHHCEAHELGDGEFMQKYHLEPVCLDEKLCGVYKLKTNKKENRP